MKTFLLITSVLLIVTEQAIAEDPSEEKVNPRYRQVRNQGGSSSGSRPNRRPPPPPAYYVETPSGNGRRVFQINRADEKIHEQLAVLGVIAQDENRRRNSPSDSATNQNQNQNGRTENQNQNGRTENQNQNGRNPTNRPSQYNRW